MDRPSSLLSVIAAVCLAILGAVGTSGAQDNRPHTESVSGTFLASPDNVMQRTCVGQDGEYLEIRGRFVGTIASSDPRLTGELEFMAEPALVNQATGLGTFRGRFAVRDPDTRMQTAQGEFHTVVTEGALNQGFALGKTMGRPGEPSDSFFANFKSTLDGSLNVTGEFGVTSADARTPAVVQGGQCSGRFTRVP
jgi:hypothetical protein